MNGAPCKGSHPWVPGVRPRPTLGPYGHLNRVLFEADVPADLFKPHRNPLPCFLNCILYAVVTWQIPMAGPQGKARTPMVDVPLSQPAWHHRTQSREET